jgi:hypothetical protein
VGVCVVTTWPLYIERGNIVHNLCLYDVCRDENKIKNAWEWPCLLSL